MRCDDPGRICSNRDPNDPCGNGQLPIPRDNAGEVKAYSDQTDGKGYSQITFCKAFHDARSLTNAIVYGTGFTDPDEKYNLFNYDNRGIYLCWTILFLYKLSRAC